MQRSNILPSALDATELQRRLAEMQRLDWSHRDGRLPLHCYFANDEVSRIAQQAHAMFASSNALAPQAFPSCKTMESEVVSMVLGLLHASTEGAGSMTSGGTESIILAVKAARDKARALQQPRQPRQPNIVVPSSAHPAFEKAGDLLGIEVRRIPVAADYRSDVSAMGAAIDADTIMLVGSAPSLPFGLFDRIEALNELALQHGLWLHVDACIGGLLSPFVQAIGRPLPAFDFRLPGVRSMSADLHKFGYAAKGASLVMYRDAADHQYQFSRFSAWPKGEYVTPTLAGTRSGGPIAAAWAVMRLLGHEGYCEITQRLMSLRDRYLAGFAKLPALSVLGEPELTVVTIVSPRLDIFSVADAMRIRGWYMSLVAEPAGIQQTINLVHEPVVDRYLADLAHAVEQASACDAAAAPRTPRHVVTY